MVRMLLLFLGLSCFEAMGQGHLYSKVEFDKTSVYLGEPLQVSVYVYTSTWFTKGIDPGNIKVDGAYTVFFRNFPNSEIINGKSYAGVQMIFDVFPYESNNIVFPSLSIRVETPDEGDYKGKPKTIRTLEKPIQVKPIPSGFSASDWLVSENVYVRDRWSKSLDDIKVGDVLTRTISTEAFGTVGQFIPAFTFDSIAQVGLYPLPSRVDNQKTKTDISGKRLDQMRYLFEKEGEVIIPEQIVTWWNPVRKRLYKRTLKAKTLKIATNPNLGMLQSVKSDLDEQLKSQSVEDDKFDYFGLDPKEFFGLISVGFLCLVFLIYSMNQLYKHLKKKKLNYRSSEAYLFDEFLGGSPQAIYHWLDRMSIHPPTLEQFSKLSGTHVGPSDIKTIEEALMKSQKLKIKKSNWIKARSYYLKSKSSSGKVRFDYAKINP